MYKIEIKSLDELDLNEINNFANKLKAHPFQTTEWMSVCQDESRVKPHAIILKKNDIVISYWLMYFRDSNFTLYNKIKIPLRECVARAGPVITNSECLCHIEDMVEVLKSVAKENGARIIIINGETTWGEQLKKHVINKGFTSDSFCTYILDFSSPLESIWRKIDKKSARWSIRNSEKKGVKCIEDNSKNGYEHFVHLAIDTWKRSGKKIKIMDMFKKYEHIIEKDMCRLFLAEYDNNIVGGLFLVYNDEVGLYYAGASSKVGFDVGANDLLQWNAITFCKNRGIKKYDLLGMECNPAKGTKQYNLKLFKSKWGGELINTPRYTWYSPELKFIKWLMKLMKIL
jgi:hypothetical protein